MPVETVTVSSKLVLRLEIGVDEEGNAILANRTYNNLKADANNQDAKTIAEDLSSLQVYPLTDIIRIDENHIG